jgi:phospholipase/carboxylesterase
VVHIEHCVFAEARLTIRRERRKDAPKRKSENGILSAQPRAKPALISSGTHELCLAGSHDAVVLVPELSLSSPQRPLILSLHGAGANAHDATQPFRRLSDERRIVVLAPNARGESWDGIDGAWGPDVDLIDAALHWVFDRCAIDPARIAIAGFSDGASYALSLGLANGDLFSHVIAFSPGFLPSTARHGKPKVFVSHGSTDALFPSARCSGRIVSRLTDDGYEVRFEEFAGGHSVPAAVARDSVDWLIR